jgi:glycosyltransferase involved in cell wall biosynthesis
MIHTLLTGRGGGERQILRLAIELQKLGHEVKIFVNAVDEETCYPNLLNKVTINVISHPLVRFKPLYRRVVKKRGIFYDSVFPRMINIGRSIPKGFDIINNHNYPTEWAALIARRRLKIPVVWMCNEPPFWFFLPENRKQLRKMNWPLFEVLDRIAVKYIDDIVVLSSIAARRVKETYNRSSKVVRSGVDVEFFHNASGGDVRKKYGLENDFILLHVGNFDPIKRQSDSIKAVYCLSRDYDNVKLILDGSGARDELVRLSEKLGVRDKVLFLQSVCDEDLAEVYAACDVFVFPSQITWGLAVTEAMAAAKPVVVSREAGASEIIQSGVNGIVVDHAKPEEIAKQVELLMNNPKLRKKIGENAYKYVKNNLSWKKYAKNMESIFKQTILTFKKDQTSAVHCTL